MKNFVVLLVLLTIVPEKFAYKLRKLSNKKDPSEFVKEGLLSVTNGYLNIVKNEAKKDGKILKEISSGNKDVKALKNELNMLADSPSRINYLTQTVPWDVYSQTKGTKA